MSTPNPRSSSPLNFPSSSVAGTPRANRLRTEGNARAFIPSCVYNSLTMQHPLALLHFTFRPLRHDHTPLQLPTGGALSIPTCPAARTEALIDFEAIPRYSFRLRVDPLLDDNAEGTSTLRFRSHHHLSLAELLFPQLAINPSFTGLHLPVTSPRLRLTMITSPLGRLSRLSMVKAPEVSARTEQMAWSSISGEQPSRSMNR